jgi:hypothetical protein
MNELRALWRNERVRLTILAGLFGFLVYEVSREPGMQVYNQYVRLAYSFLHGKVYIFHPEPWVERVHLHGKSYLVHPDTWLELVRYKGRFYSHQGVLPGILLMPFVAIFGLAFDLKHFAALLGAGISAAAWSLATRTGLTGRQRVVGWAFPVLGTTVWYEAKFGSTWGVAALTSVLFLFLSLNEYFGRRRPALIGLFVGLAALSRPPAIFALAGFAVAILGSREARANLEDVVKKGVQFAAGALGPIYIYVGYNVLRFGTFFDKSQQLHYLQDSFRLQVPPGQFALAHLPYNLYSWFLLGPDFQRPFPYIHLTILGTALPLTSPAFVTALGARRDRWLWLAALCVVGPAAFHYANGFAQFGMRYLLDAVPFLSALIFLALKDRRAFGYTPLLVASIAINAYGVAYTTVYGLKM